MKKTHDKNETERFQYYCHEIIKQNKEIIEDYDVLNFIRHFDAKTEYHQDLFNQASLVLMATRKNMTIDERIERIDTCLMFFKEMSYTGLSVLFLSVMNDFKEELEKKSIFLRQAKNLTKQ